MVYDDLKDLDISARIRLAELLDGVAGERGDPVGPRRRVELSAGDVSVLRELAQCLRNHDGEPTRVWPLMYCSTCNQTQPISDNDPPSDDVRDLCCVHCGLVIVTYTYRRMPLPASAPAPQEDAETPTLTGQWCVEAFHRVNPGAHHTPYRSIPSLYLRDFAREVVRAVVAHFGVSQDAGRPRDRRIAEIRDRLAKATPGPWTWEDWDGAPPRTEPEYLTTLVAPPTSRPNGPSSLFPNLGNKLIGGDDINCTEDDKAFIAHAPEDIAMLLEVIDELRHALNIERTLRVRSDPAGSEETR